MKQFRYTDAQEECDFARERFIRLSLCNLADEVLSDPEVYKGNSEDKNMLIEDTLKDQETVTKVLDELKHQFWINWEDK